MLEGIRHMNILRFLPFLALAALVVSAPVMAQNDPMGAGSFSGSNGGDIESLANTEMLETSQDSERDLKDQMRKVKEQNDKKKAQRDSAQKINNEKARLKAAVVKPGVRPVNANPPGKIIPPPKTVPPGLQAKTRSIEDLKDEKDSIGDMNGQDQLNMQGYQERQTKAQKMISDVAKKSSDTQSTISGNMK